MRIHLKISLKGCLVPFNHQKKLTAVIHKWLGKENNEHGNISLYSFSALTGGKKSKNENSLIFENETSFFISAYNPELIKRIIEGIQRDPLMFDGLKVNEIIIQENPDLSNKDYFLTASPIFIKRRLQDGNIKHFEYKDEEANTCLVETLKSKMDLIGLKDDTLDIYFDINYPKAKNKLIQYNKIQNKVNVCPVFIKGKTETKLFAWNVGLGNSTGIGFGAIK